jgi:hypothetical protein
MSTIKVDNIRIASESVSRPVTGVAAAWVHFSTGTTTVIRDTFNMSILKDGGIGETTLSYTSEMASNDYPLTMGSNATNCSETNSNHTASGCRIITTDANDNNTDVNSVSIVTFGDLA